MAVSAIDVNGDSRIIPPKLFFDANSVAIAVPSDSPYKIILSLLTPRLLSHSMLSFASVYKFFSVGFPELPLKPLQDIINILMSSLFSSFNLWTLLNRLPLFPLYYSGKTLFMPIHVSDLTDTIYYVISKNRYPIFAFK